MSHLKKNAYEKKASLEFPAIVFSDKKPTLSNSKKNGLSK